MRWADDNEWIPRSALPISADDGTGEEGGAGGASADDAGDSASGATATQEIDFTAALQGKRPAELLTDEALRQDPTISGYADLDSLAKSHVSLQKMLGAKDRLLQLPGEDATEEQRNEFWSKLGRPDAPDGYSLADPEGLPEGSPGVNEELVNGFRAKAHEAGLTSAQANELYSWFRQTEAGALSQMTEQREAQAAEARQTLQREWGAAFEDKLAAAESVLADQPEEFTEFLKTSGLNNHPHMVRLLAQLAEASQEDGPRAGGASGGKMTPDQAMAEVNRLRGDEAFRKAWMDQNHPGHDDAVRKLQRLYEMAHPEARSG